MNCEELNNTWIRIVPHVVRILKMRQEYTEDLINDTYIQLYNIRHRITPEWSNVNIIWYAVSIAEIIIRRERYKYHDIYMVEFNDDCKYKDTYNLDKSYIYNMIDFVLNTFENIKKNGKVNYVYKESRRKVLDMYLQGYSFTEIAKTMNRSHHHGPIAILWSTIRDIQKILNLPVSPASNQSGILMQIGRPQKNSYLKKNML